MNNALPVSSLCFVVPRYGEFVGGGCETLVRLLAHKLAALGIEIHVLTTCSSDHRTWNNDLAQGITQDGEVVVHRFKVDDRDIDVFLGCEQQIAQFGHLSAKDQITWLENGVNSIELYDFLTKKQGEYDLIFFAPYLFPISVWGSMLCAENAILIPCLHDEPYAYLEITRRMFSMVRGVMWNSKPEGDLAESLYKIPNLKSRSHEVGMGFSSLKPNKLSSTKNLVELPDQFILYSGRKETGKNVDFLIDCYTRYRETSKQISNKDPLPLVLIGSGSLLDIGLTKESAHSLGVVDLGFVTEVEKLEIMKRALLLCQPSANESFSIVIMEAWQNHTPVVVHDCCPVTKYHVDQSGGGFSFSDGEGLSKAIDNLRNNPELRNLMGSKGAAYVIEKYSWESVIDRFLTACVSWTR